VFFFQAAPLPGVNQPEFKKILGEVKIPSGEADAQEKASPGTDVLCSTFLQAGKAPTKDAPKKEAAKEAPKKDAAPKKEAAPKQDAAPKKEGKQEKKKAEKQNRRGQNKKVNLCTVHLHKVLLFRVCLLQDKDAKKEDSVR